MNVWFPSARERLAHRLAVLVVCWLAAGATGAAPLLPAPPGLPGPDASRTQVLPVVNGEIFPLMPRRDLFTQTIYGVLRTDLAGGPVFGEWTALAPVVTNDGEARADASPGQTSAGFLDIQTVPVMAGLNPESAHENEPAPGDGGRIQVGSLSFNRTAQSLSGQPTDFVIPDDVSRQLKASSAAPTVAAATPITAWTLAGIGMLAAIIWLSLNADDRRQRDKRHRHRHGEGHKHRRRSKGEA
jgi:hypothetical protein